MAQSDPSSLDPTTIPDAQGAGGAVASTTLPDGVTGSSDTEKPLELGEQIDRLISEIESAAPAAPSPDAATPAEPPPPVQPADPQSTSDLAEELDQALQEAGAALQGVIPPEDPVVPDAGVSPAPSGAPEPLLQPAPDAPSIDAASISELDDALAHQAEALNEAAERQTAPAPTRADPTPPVAESPAPIEPAAVVPHESAHAGHADAPPHASIPHATASHATTTPGHATADSTHHRSTPHASRPRPAPTVASTIHHAPAPAPPPTFVSRASRLAARALSGPMGALPESAREAVGYLAAVTIFNAAAAWIYVLFLHTPPVHHAHDEGPHLHASQPAEAHPESPARHDAPHDPASAPVDAPGHDAPPPSDADHSPH